ncbi:hypothetical protein B7C51_15625 [Paenibacillus larvae subsp. pulvifaciens]|uniref:Uncharacterized protein n=1 Tax=Paenibacillus larvae subsp. pulvifaciens TaxID=1477 RepID=A0A1V0UUJ7_9BACL|nr:hypothetical protein [Paenibacillus larvae]ARF68919.1 hypothetical protein B7C51_15625 [Paenibacillus larvae subsp. pulvifaciens]
MNKITAAGYDPLIKRDGNVFNKYGEPLADSREVAELLSVDHSRLVEDIYDLEVPDDIYFANFTPDFVREGRKFIWVFYMTHIGYDLLVRKYRKKPVRCREGVAKRDTVEGGVP